MPHTGQLRLFRTFFGVLIGAALAFAACKSPEFDVADSASSTASVATGTGGSAPTGGSGGAAGAAGQVSGHCDNGVPDANETGVDCGGRECEPCRVGEPCKVGTDCVNGECNGNVCRNASCLDDLSNGGETDIDCGGLECPACPPNKACQKASDCTSRHCGDDMICEEANCEDRIVNGNETDVDCGGSCGGCDVGDACLLGSDCAAPPDSNSESVSCEPDSETCVLLCGSGTADCNQSAVDGCEAALSVSLEHCGECEKACQLDNADTQCQGGTCEIVACAAGFRNCNGLAEDGCEIDIMQDPLNCGDCENPCSDRNGEASCEAGECSITCDDGFDDCNQDLLDGCEANLNRSVDHCGDCETVCEGSAPEQTPFCTLETGCGETECEAGLGDCDGNGECSDDMTSVADCGRCGNTCLAPNGTPACEEQACTVQSCDSGPDGDFADCDGVVGNGCERNLRVDRRFCGDCSNDCTSILGAGVNVTDVACGEASCVVVSCEVGFADCDGTFENGCEVDLTANAENCGGCLGAGGIDCTSEYTNGSGSCEASICSFVGCDATFADCNQNAGAGSARDGCEISIAFNDDHCGGCDIACQTGTGTSSNTCGGTLGDTCQPTCEADYDDCDNLPQNGCEAALLTDAAHCGSCDSACLDEHAANECVAGVCQPECEDGFLSCNDDPNDGCEQASTIIEHCGDCDAACGTAGNAVPACSVSGECSVTCSGNTRSCNDENVARDGCEINIATNPNHCGGCGQSCASTNVATRACQARVCRPTCTSGFCPAVDPAAGCTVPLGTSANCAECGQTCVAPTPFCASDGGFHCDFLDIAVVNSGLGASIAWNGSESSVISLSHPLAGDASDYRMVLLGVSGNLAPQAVSYGDLPLGAPLVFNDEQSEVWVGIYAVLEAELPSQASPQARIEFPSGWGWGQLDVIELSGVDQNDPIVTSSGGSSSNATGCGGGSARTAGVTFSGAPGSFVYAVLAGRQATSATLQSAGFSGTFNEVSPSPASGSEHGFMAAAHSGPQSNGSSASWNLVNCYRSAGAALGIRRAESL